MRSLQRRVDDLRRTIRILAFALVAGASSAQVAVDNGPYQTHANGGFNNAPRSVVQAATLFLNNYGFGCQKSIGNRVADDLADAA